ncbi:hypothetical protein Vadar_006455 [Vaccinium darrowii]|uniref:Uncharacterized protein n=1 Tax=Vaccinium darrowii TaxID=229202 RepID=A0ACB7XFQ9_9ERIC|nr:hypothetical protein Vadar_006455 [Vaccinium darrowii]
MAPVDDGGGDKTRILESLKKSCKMILFNTFKELEGKYLDYLPLLLDKKIVSVGPVVQEIVDENKDSKILQWLKTKDELSSVFVSFASENFLSKEEWEELAHGLELSGVNFIWVVKFPVGEGPKIEEALPVEFLDRIGKRGLVVDGWAPQAQILAHSSTGGFLSHCGWNSTLESLKFGVPIIAMPMSHDQPINDKVLEDVGVGVEIERNANRRINRENIAHDQPINGKVLEDVGVGVEIERNANSRINRENIAQVITKVVKDESGADLRTKAREFSEIIRMKGEKDIDGMVEGLLQLCNEGKWFENY